MKPVIDFFPRILPYVPGCSEPLAAQAIVDSAIAFCDESLVLRQKQDRTTTVSGTSEYTLDKPNQQQVSRIMNVWVDGTLLPPVAMEESQLPATANAKPVAYYTTRVDSEFLLVLYPAPDAAYTLDVEVALRPTRSATSLQDDLFDLWVEPVVAGAMGRIQSIPNQPFSSPGEGHGRLLISISQARKARVEGGFGRVKSTVSIKPRAFA